MTKATPRTEPTFRDRWEAVRTRPLRDFQRLFGDRILTDDADPRARVPFDPLTMMRAKELVLVNNMLKAFPLRDVLAQWARWTLDAPCGGADNRKLPRPTQTLCRWLDDVLASMMPPGVRIDSTSAAAAVAAIIAITKVYDAAQARLPQGYPTEAELETVNERAETWREVAVGLTECDQRIRRSAKRKGARRGHA